MDMLMLARRGVRIAEIITLKFIVEEYLATAQEIVGGSSYAYLGSIRRLPFVPNTAL